jgi:hypothetical protein
MGEKVVEQRGVADARLASESEGATRAGPGTPDGLIKPVAVGLPAPQDGSKSVAGCTNLCLWYGDHPSVPERAPSVVDAGSRL